MVTNPKEIKILLYGNIPSGLYRSNILIGFLRNSGYFISEVRPDFYKTKKLEHFPIVEKLLIAFCWVELFIKAAFADVIYLLPDNTRFIKSAIWASKIFSKKLVVEIYISLYDTLVRDRKLIRDGSRKAKVALNRDRLALTQPDYIIHTSSHELVHWEKLLGTSVDLRKVFVAPLCSVYPVTLRRSFMQDSSLNICWWGTFIPLHGLDNILQAMRILQEAKLKFTCSLFGVDNSFFSIYADKIKQNKLEDHVFLRKDLSFSNGSLPQYLIDNCDLALGIFGNTDKAYNAVPNKLIEALSMGIPTLTMSSPALREFFNPENDFWACEPAPESIAASILTIAGGTAHPVDWEQTRQKVLNIFSVARYQEVVSKVLEGVMNELSGEDSSNIPNRVLATDQPIASQTNQ